MKQLCHIKAFPILIFSILLSSGVHAESLEKLLGQYSLSIGHESVTGIGFSNSFDVEIYKDNGAYLARYTASGKGFYREFICKPVLRSKKLTLTFLKDGEFYNSSRKVGEKIIAFKLTNYKENVALKPIDREFEVINPIFEKKS